MPIKLHVQLVAHCEKSKTERCLIIQGIHGLVEPFNDGDPAAPWLLLEFRMRAFIGTKYVRSAFQLGADGIDEFPKDGSSLIPTDTSSTGCVESCFLPAIVRAANAELRRVLDLRKQRRDSCRPSDEGRSAPRFCQGIDPVDDRTRHASTQTPEAT